MTTLENRPNAALLVVDVQNGVVAGAHRRDEVVANVGSLVERARREWVPVVWVQHSDEQFARGSAAAGSGDRTHQPVLDLSAGAWSDGRDGQDEGRRVRRRAVVKRV